MTIAGLYLLGLTIVSLQLYIIFNKRTEKEPEEPIEYNYSPPKHRGIRHGIEDDRSLSGALIADPVIHHNLPARPDPLRFIKDPKFDLRFVTNRTIDAYGRFVEDVRIAVVRVL